MAWKEIREGTAVAEQWTRRDEGMVVVTGGRAREGAPRGGADGRARAGGNGTRLGGRTGATGSEVGGKGDDDDRGSIREGAARGATGVQGDERRDRG